MKYMTLKDEYNLKVSSHITDYIAPLNVYVPLKTYHLKVKSNEYVYKEQELSPNVYSPVSGVVIGVEKCLNALGREEACLIIKNDGKEQYQKPKNLKSKLTNYQKEEVINLSSKFNYENIIQVLKDLQKNTILIINAIEDELYVANNVMILERKTDLILETLNALSEIFNINNIILALKDSDSASVAKIFSNSARYPQIKIKLIPNYYGLGDDLNLLNYLYPKNNNQVSFLHLNDLIKIYNLLKMQKLTTKKYLTITGNLIAKPQVINIKIGSKVKEVIKKLKIKSKNYIVIVNGLMQNKQLNLENLIVTEDLDSIFIMSPRKAGKEIDCLNCGLCHKFCPRHLNPQQLNKLKKVDINLKKQCNNCNLCTYLCPAKINLTKWKEG